MYNSFGILLHELDQAEAMSIFRDESAMKEIITDLTCICWYRRKTYVLYLKLASTLFDHFKKRNDFNQKKNK